MQRFICLIFLSLLALGAQAQVYKHVDEQGNVTFTDQPPPDSDSTPIQINSTNIASPPPADAYPTPPPAAADSDAASYSVKITAPANKTIIPNGPGNFSVSASVTPSLKSTHKLQLLLDGEPRQEPQEGSSWALTNVFRGEHQLTVSVLDEDGKSIAKSEPVTVFVFRPSSNKKSRNRPPRPTPTR